MNLNKLVYTTFIATTLTTFFACSDNDSSSAAITTPGNSSEIDFADSSSIGTESGNAANNSSSNNSTVANDSTTAKDSTAAKDSSVSKDKSSSSSDNNSTISSSSDNNSTSSSSFSNNETSSSSFINNEGACIVKLDSLYGYPVICDSIRFGNLYSKDGEIYPIAVDGQICTLNDHMDADSIVEVTCDGITYTLYKKYNNRAGGVMSAYSEPTLVSCDNNDLWCHNPIVDGTTAPVGSMTYQENEGIYFSSPGTHDLSDWDGICITYTADTNVNILLDLGETKNQEFNNNLPYISLRPRPIIPSEICYTWSEFKPARWTSPAISGKEAAKTIAHIKIQNQPTANFNLIRLKKYLLKENYSYNKINCGENYRWCAEYGEDGIISGCGKEQFGTWEAQTDATSSITWPGKIGNEFNPNSLLGIIEYYQALTGKFTLGNGENAYVKIGFKLDYATQENFDITSWGGFCFVYKSTHDFEIELAPFNADDSQSIPKVSIPKSLEPTVVNLSWDSFNPSDASAVNRINTVFREAAETTGYFAFYTLGEPGSCTIKEFK